MAHSRKLAITFVLAVLPTVFLAASVDTRPEETRAADWVKDHADALPSTLAEIEGFPVVYRRRIFFSSTPEVKSRLWHEQLAQILVAEPLTPDQRAFLEQKLAKAFVPEAFVKGTPANSRLRELCGEVSRLWKDDRPKRLFGQLGQEQRFGSLRAVAVRLSARLSALAAPTVAASESNQPEPYCTCNDDSVCEECTSCPTCRRWDACGCFLLWECNGWEEGGCPALPVSQ